MFITLLMLLFCCSATVKGRYGRHTSGMAGKKLLKVKNVSLQILASSEFWHLINNAILEMYQNKLHLEICKKNEYPIFLNN